MKWIVVFIYWLTTWTLKYVLNFLELIWHLNTKRLTYYGTHFISVKYMKEAEIEDGFNFIERVVYRCVK